MNVTGELNKLSINGVNIKGIEKWNNINLSKIERIKQFFKRIIYYIKTTLFNKKITFKFTYGNTIDSRMRVDRFLEEQRKKYFWYKYCRR